MKQKTKTMEELVYEKECDKLASRIMQLDSFLGGLQDYTAFKRAQSALLEGDTIEILDTGKPGKFIPVKIYGSNFYNYPEHGMKKEYEKLFDDGLIGFIHVDSYSSVGTPVGIKRKAHPFR